MWKSKREDGDRSATPSDSPLPPLANVLAGSKEARSVETPRTGDNFRADIAHIGKSVLVKGELSGSEDLYLDGEVEGSIELRDHRLTIGPNGRVRANVNARDVVVHGKLQGNIRAIERVELKKSAVLVGDVATQRIAIEDGAFFKGGIDIQRDGAKSEGRRESAMGAAAGAGHGSHHSVYDSGSSSSGSRHSALVEPKKY